MTQTQADAMKTAFLGLRSVQLNDVCDGAPIISGDKAQWACAETICYVSTSRTPVPDAHHAMLYHFKRAGERWVIDRREGVGSAKHAGN